MSYPRSNSLWRAICVVPRWALHLDPACLLSGAIGAVAPFRDDAFQPAYVARGEEPVAIIKELRVAQSRPVSCDVPSSLTLPASVQVFLIGQCMEKRDQRRFLVAIKEKGSDQR